MAALRTALASAALLLAGGALLGWATDGFRAFTTESARRLAVQRAPVAVPNLILQDQSGHRFALADLRGRWLLVDFIYTSCPTLCLALGGDFAQLQAALARPIAQDRVVLLSITFDPVRDTADRLTDYLNRFGSHGAGWRAARPLDAAALARLERTFGITVIADGVGGYTHNGGIHLVDPHGRLVQILDSGNPAAVAREAERRLRS
ncbi:MAG: SCO family protein [Burkholderiales bacterium]